jgi:hypothetical protein
MITRNDLAILREHLRIGEAMFAEVYPVNDALRRAIETLEALPETKDGARVIPHVSRVWHPVYGEGWLAARLHGSFYTKEHPKDRRLSCQSASATARKRRRRPPRPRRRTRR